LKVTGSVVDGVQLTSTLVPLTVAVTPVGAAAACTTWTVLGAEVSTASPDGDSATARTS
jgi:hypothetical protein